MRFIAINKDNYNSIAAIYKEGLDSEIASFETKVPNFELWNAKHLAFGRIALEKEGTILGWASLSPVSSREVYKGLAEVSIYIAIEARGSGLGKILLNKLIVLSEENGIWTLQSSIFRANEASISIHRNCGFRIVGFKEKVAQRNGVWHDNILLERRSKKVQYPKES